MLSYDWPGQHPRGGERDRARRHPRHREAASSTRRTCSPAANDSATSASRSSRDGKLVATDPQELLAAQAEPDREVDRVSRRISNLLHGEGEGEAPTSVSLDDIETMLLKKAVERAHGNVAAAARLLGITRPQMVYRLKSRGIAHDGDTSGRR